MTAPESPRAATPFAGRLRWAGLCLIAGLLIQLASLAVSHPVTFMLFLGPGAALVVLGAGIFLSAVFQQSQRGWDGFGHGSE